MKITNINKLPKARYKITFDDDSDLILYENVVLKHVLLIGKQVDESLKQKIMLDHGVATPYYQSLNYINTRLRSKEEVRVYLLKKDHDESLVNETISRLEEEGYINDKLFVESFVNDKINLTYDGIYKIKRGLEKYKVDDEIIDNVTSNVHEEEMNKKIDKLIAKQVRLNTRYTGNVLKNRILNYLLTLGYDKYTVLEKLNHHDFKGNGDLEKEYNCLFKKYAKRYDKPKLMLVIRQHLFQKGYDIEDINHIVNEKNT